MKNEIKVSVVGIKTYPAGNGKNSTIITVALDSNNNITAEMSLYSNNTIGDSVNVFVEGKKVAYVGCAFAEKPYSVMKSVSRDYKYRNLSWSLNNAGWHSKSLAMSWEGEIKKEYRTANKYFLAILAEWGLTLEDIYAMSNVAIETLMNIRESTIETDGTEDDADEENVAMTIDHNFDVEEEDDELVDEAEVAVTAEEDNTTATEVQEDAKAAKKLVAYGVKDTHLLAPAGFVKYDKGYTDIWGIGKFNWIAYYKKPLDEKEISRYDLVDIEAKTEEYKARHTPEAMAKAEKELEEYQKQLKKERAREYCAECEKALREIDAKIAELQNNDDEEAKKELDKLIVKRGKIATNCENEKAELASLEGDVDVTEYAVSPDAQEVAVQAEIDNAAREVQEEVSVTADLEKQLEKVLEDRDSRYAMIEDIRGEIKYVQALIIDCYKTIADYENATNDDLIDLDHNFKEIERLQASAEELQAEIINRKLNAAAVGMVDDGTNEEDAEEMTIDYNFNVEDSDDELIDTAIEYHIVEIPAAVELVPVTFALERFGYDEVDEDAEIKALLEEYEMLDAEAEELYKKYYEKRKAAEKVRHTLEDVLQKNFKQSEKAFYEMVEKAGDNDAEIKLITQDGKYYCGKTGQLDIAEGEWEKFKVYVEFVNKINCVVSYRDVRIAEYQTLKKFKTVVREFVSAIERGDKEFALPCGDR